ncbi:hypothetical protein [Paenibacillus sp. UNC451MF]|uniref:hypothetical protein n=1 Tax=Paenibacillus sp. UNC451MF TaxID=1449063 RepID=UPI00048BE11F|nr:hypothetical protein [Paenibacillus sp. UNC451MF]
MNKSLMVRQVGMDQGRLLLSGTTSNSAAGFSGYSYTVDKGNLYITLRYSLLSSSGEFAIEWSTKEAPYTERLFAGELF